MIEVLSLSQANSVNVRRNGDNEKQQRHGDGDVHPEHALFWILRIGHDAEEDEEKAYACGDQCSWMGAAGCDVAKDAKHDEQNAEADGQFCHESGTPRLTISEYRICEGSAVVEEFDKCDEAGRKIPGLP